VKLKQKQVIESLLRVQAFLGANPAPAPVSYGPSKDMLDDVVGQLGEHTGAQVLGLQLSKAQQKRQIVVARKLRDHHMRPIVTIAKSGVDVDPGIADAFRLPPANAGVVRLIAAAEAMREAAGPIAASFVTAGRAADFVEQLAAAITALRESVGGRGTILGTHIGAKAGIKQQLRRGRLAVARLDSIVRVAFEGNDVVLARWGAVKRVRAVPVVAGSDGSTELVPATLPGSAPVAA